MPLAQIRPDSTSRLLSFQSDFPGGAWTNTIGVVSKPRKLSVGTPQHRQQVAAINPPLEAEIKQLTAQQKKLDVARFSSTCCVITTPSNRKPITSETLAALKVADNNRTLTAKDSGRTTCRKRSCCPIEQQPASVLASTAQPRTNSSAKFERIRREHGAAVGHSRLVGFRSAVAHVCVAARRA